MVARVTCDGLKSEVIDRQTDVGALSNKVLLNGALDFKVVHELMRNMLSD